MCYNKTTLHLKIKEQPMKLLIVDDEALTRTGLISSVDWKALGIHEIYQADDGYHGLEMARLHSPEIILCDVRMPRMDGIDMLQRIEEFLPDSVAIFMSGYSDKEYLKAAIRLKAITYIEKPLDPKEVTAAIQEACKSYQQKIRSHRGEALHSLATASLLAQQLTTPYGANQKEIEALTGELSLRIMPGTFFTAFIVSRPAVFDISDVSENEILHSLEEFLRYYHMNCVSIEKRQYLVYFVFGSTRPSSSVIRSIGKFFSEQYAPLGKHYIIAGNTFAGISRAYQSYASAVVLLQSSFFFPENTFLTPEMLKTLPSKPADALCLAPEDAFHQLLTDKDQAGCTAFFRRLWEFFSENCTLLPNQVKDIYYKLFISLEDARKQQQLSSDSSGAIVDALEACFSYEELHRTLISKTQAYLEDAANSTQENATIFLIKDYISKNYMNESLSVKDISAHVFLSASYVCTFFKNETSQTLNQYLTEYRMEKAKQLLSDARYKIADISSRVGYSDGNYFGKSFKKYTGLSPSEYREKIL